MKLKAVYEIQGLSNVLTGKRKSEGVANPGDIYEVDNATAKVHIAEGYAVDPNDEAASTERFSGPQIIEGELAQDAPLTLNDIAPPAAPAPKKAGKKKATEAAAPAAEAVVDDLGLDDDSDSVE